MKKSLIVALLATFSLTGCNGNNTSTTKSVSTSNTGSGSIENDTFHLLYKSSEGNYIHEYNYIKFSDNGCEYIYYGKTAEKKSCTRYGNMYVGSHFKFYILPDDTVLYEYLSTSSGVYYNYDYYVSLAYAKAHNITIKTLSDK